MSGRFRCTSLSQVRGRSVRIAALVVLATCSEPMAPIESIRGQIVFASVRDGNWNIYRVNPDGTGLLRLTSNPAHEYQPALSTDRRRIAFFSEISSAGIYIINVDGTGFRLGHSGPGSGSVEHLSWSADDRLIAFQGKEDAFGGFAVWTMNVENGTATRIRVNAGRPSLSPDGNRIAFTDMQFGDLWVMNRDGSNVQPLTANGDYPAWSPDGNKIAFTSDRDGPLNIYVMNSDGTSPTRVTTNQGVADKQPSWSPEGTHLVFTREVFPSADIWTVRVDGAELSHVTTGAGASW